VNNILLSSFPKISVLIPTFNVEEFIGPCLQSILDQTYPADCIEVIAVDNCSSDKTFDVVNSYKKLFGERLKSFQNKENKGPSVSLNRAYRESQNEYLFILYSDNMIQPDCLESMVQQLSLSNITGGIVFCDHDYIDSDGKVIGHWNASHLGEGEINRELLESCYIDKDGSKFRPIQFLIDRKTFEKVGPYNEECFIDDWEFTIRYITKVKFYRVPESLILFRILHNSLGNQPDIYADSLLDVIENYADKLNTKNNILFVNTVCRTIILYVAKGQYQKGWAKFAQHQKKFLGVKDIPSVVLFFIKSVIKDYIKRKLHLGVVWKAKK